MNEFPDSQAVAEAEPPPAPAPAKVRRRVVPKTPAKRVAVLRAGGARPVTPRPTFDHSEQVPPDGFFKRNVVALIVAGILAAGGVGFFFYKPGPATPAPVKQERIVSIAPLPPPPKPLPPPPKPKPPEEKMEKETAPTEEAKPVEKPPVKAPDDPAPLGTNLKGDGPGLSGLGTGSGLGGGTIGGNGGAKSGSRFGWYAGQVQSKISEALRRHPRTRDATMQLDVRVWPDATGRIKRAQIVSGTGDPALDLAIQNNVLTGLQLQQPPPSGMKLPINLRLTARRPN